MKKYFVETNAYSMVVFVDEQGNAFPIHEKYFDERLTLDVAKKADYSGIDGCETAEEVAFAIGGDTDDIFNFETEKFEKVVEF